MNNIQHQLAVKEAVQGKFGKKKTIDVKVKPKYPMSAEREFRRIINSYMKMYRDTLKEHLPAIIESYKENYNNDSRFDDNIDFGNKLNSEFNEMNVALEKKINEFGLEKFIEKIGSLTKATSLKEWKRVVSKTLGIDLLDDYYKGDFYAIQLRQWVDENVQKIKSIPNIASSEMKNVILEGYTQGKPIREIQRDIQKKFGSSKRDAELLARDQISTLSSQITRFQQTDAGINEYTWSTSRDSRVRDCHKSLDGKSFSWDDAPEMWYITKSRGKVFTGRKCHPGEDYCCRCVALPKFNLETLDLPMK